LDGSKILQAKAEMPATLANAVTLGQRLAEDLLSQGAAELIANERTARSLATEGP
jgi:porphobilinogen deaminase